jgi:hypothetical protein
MSSFNQFIKAIGVIFGLKKEDSRGRRRTKKKISRNKKPRTVKQLKSKNKKGAAKPLSSKNQVPSRKRAAIPAHSSKTRGLKNNIPKKAHVQSRRVVTSPKKPIDLKKVGEITHFFSRISVAVVRVTHHSLVLGDKIRVKGELTDYVQVVRSLQVESVEVQVAKKGQIVGLKVNSPVKVKDEVYKY